MRTGGHWRRAGPLRLATVIFSIAIATRPMPGIAGETLQGAPAATDMLALLKQAAWVQEAAKACRDESPSMLGHLVQAYDAWRERNVQIREALHWLDVSPSSAEHARSRQTYDDLRRDVARFFGDKRTNDLEDFTRECDRFTKELAKGSWDYPISTPPN
jgi:hypothetical protein